jgi:ribose 5-phosphate isomerase A
VTMPLSSKPDRPKRTAAARAIDEVKDGMILGLGSGSTAALAIKALAARIAKNLRVVETPISETMAALTRRLGVPLTSFADHRRVDVAIDGADQVARGTLDLVKGLGGALLREKLVASASDRVIVAVDETIRAARGDRLVRVADRARSAGGDRLRAAAALGRRQTFHGGRRQPHR